MYHYIKYAAMDPVTPELYHCIFQWISGNHSCKLFNYTFWPDFRLEIKEAGQNFLLSSFLHTPENNISLLSDQRYSWLFRCDSRWFFYKCLSACVMRMTHNFCRCFQRAAQFYNLMAMYMGLFILTCPRLLWLVSLYGSLHLECYVLVTETWLKTRVSRLRIQKET